MKPKTILQKEIVKLSAQLPVISEKQVSWFHENMTKYAARSRNSLYCLECGHKWFDPFVMGSKLLGCTCPNCLVELKMKDAYTPHFSENMYCSAVTTKGNKQVVRMIYMQKYYSKREAAKYFHNEVMQHWIEPSGKITTLSGKVNSMSGYYDNWVWGSKLEVRCESSNLRARVDINSYCTYPKMSIVPVLKRNGFSGQFYHFSPHRLFQLILSNNKAETLLKTGQIHLLESMYVNSKRITDYWKSICICIRNNYTIFDTSMWFDYLGFLEYFQKDLFNPKYICPDNLKTPHDELLAKKQKIQAEKSRIDTLRKSVEIQKIYTKEKRKFFGLEFIKGNISVNPLKTIAEFYDEGEFMNHCVFHSGYYKKKNSLILSAKINDTPVETIEISLKPLKIIQARGTGNEITEFHDEIMEIVNSNLYQISKCK